MTVGIENASDTIDGNRFWIASISRDADGMKPAICGDRKAVNTVPAAKARPARPPTISEAPTGPAKILPRESSSAAQPLWAVAADPQDNAAQKRSRRVMG